MVAVINAAGDPLPVGGDKDTSKEVPPEPKAGRIAPPGLTTTGHPAPFATDILLTGLSDQAPFCIWVFTETTADGTPKARGAGADNRPAVASAADRHRFADIRAGLGGGAAARQRDLQEAGAPHERRQPRAAGVGPSQRGDLPAADLNRDF